jgi:RimJ/RimL family protein N-acetyltransferase
MFVRTQRLTLRPGWPEDAPALAAAIGHLAVVRNLARAPWPYSLAAAESFCAGFGDPLALNFLVHEHDGGAVRLVGGVAIGPLGEERHELGYWLTPAAWGRGLAGEAASAALAAARARGVRRVTSGHFADNPASGRVLRKLGFRDTGARTPLFSQARGEAVLCHRYERNLDDPAGCGEPDPEPRLAA